MFLLVSLPLLITTLNTPFAKFGLTISHLKLSLEPLGNEPLVPSVEVLFIIVPSPRVSNVKAFTESDAEAAIKDDVAALNEPDATLVTNNEVPPFWK